MHFRKEFPCGWPRQTSASQQLSDSLAGGRTQAFGAQSLESIFIMSFPGDSDQTCLRTRPMGDVDDRAPCLGTVSARGYRRVLLSPRNWEPWNGSQNSSAEPTGRPLCASPSYIKTGENELDLKPSQCIKNKQSKQKLV